MAAAVTGHPPLPTVGLRRITSARQCEAVAAAVLLGLVAAAGVWVLRRVTCLVSGSWLRHTTCRHSRAQGQRTTLFPLGMWLEGRNRIPLEGRRGGQGSRRSVGAVRLSLWLQCRFARRQLHLRLRHGAPPRLGWAIIRRAVVVLPHGTVALAPRVARLRWDRHRSSRILTMQLSVRRGAVSGRVLRMPW